MENDWSDEHTTKNGKFRMSGFSCDLKLLELYVRWKQESPIQWVKIGGELKLLGWGVEFRIKIRRLN